MFLPTSFRVDDLSRIHDFIEKNSFATLVSRQTNGEMIASHIPLLIDRTRGPHGTLEGHLARANPQGLKSAGDMLAIFHGPHAYISPTWYDTEETVPTWNYVAVHAYGPVEIVEEAEEVLGILRKSMEKYEGSMPTPWTLERSGAAVAQMLPAIVAFRIPIQKIEGKWKLNQHHPVARQEGVVRALEAQGDENSLAIAELMRQNVEGL
jgi:transcriptional regulator